MREGKVEAGAVDVDGEDGRDAVRARDGAREEADRAGAEDDEALRPLRRGERRREACAARGVDVLVDRIEVSPSQFYDRDIYKRPFSTKWI